MRLDPGQSVLAELPSSMRAQSPNETRSIEASFVHSGLDTGPVVQGAVRIDGEFVLKRFVARNVKAITPIAWNQTIGGQLFSALDGGQGPGEPLPVQPGVHVEPPAPDVQRPELPDSNVMQPIPEDDIVEYPDGAPGDLVRDMKEADPSFRAPLQQKRQVESTTPQTRKPGELKIARQDPSRALPLEGSPMPRNVSVSVSRGCKIRGESSFPRHPGVLHVTQAWLHQEFDTMLSARARELHLMLRRVQVFLLVLNLQVYDCDVRLR